MANVIIIETDPPEFSIKICACHEGPYIGARKAGTPDRCERCSFMTQEQYEALVGPHIDKAKRFAVMLSQASMQTNAAFSEMGGQITNLRASLIEIATVVQNNCTGCFQGDHPCGDPVCAIKQEVRAVVRAVLMSPQEDQ